MAKLEDFTHQEILETGASVTVQLIAGVFRSAGVPVDLALRFLARASGLSSGSTDELETFTNSCALLMDKDKTQVSPVDLMTFIFMKMVEQRLTPPKPPEAFASSVNVAPPEEPREEVSE